MSHGFVTLGLLMVFVGVSILGNLNKAATSQSALGMSFWQIVIASGILTMIMGFANIVAVSQRARMPFFYFPKMLMLFRTELRVPITFSWRYRSHGTGLRCYCAAKGT
jgi:uncharacterized membrane protein YqgA involved in biofilm formation